MDNKKIKVLLTAFNNLDIGGIQKMIMTLVENLNDVADFDIIVFSSNVGFYEAEFQKYGRVFKCPNYEGTNSIRRKIDYYIRYSRIRKNVMRIIKENGPYDVIHTNAFFESAPCLEAAYQMGIPVRISHSHNTGTKDTGSMSVRIIKQIYKKEYQKRIIKFATDCVGCSDAAREYLFGKENGYVIFNCIEDHKFSVNTQRDWQELKVLNVGNFVEQKNQLFLLEVFKELLCLIPDCHLTLIGRVTPYFDKVKAEIEQWNLQNRISVLPSTADISKVMGQCDYFLLPSKFEGLPLVLLEAQRSGMRCFASTNVTQECNCGLVTYLPLGNAREWAVEIYRYYIENGPKKYNVEMSKFSKKAYLDAFLKIYSKAEE